MEAMIVTRCSKLCIADFSFMVFIKKMEKERHIKQKAAWGAMPKIKGIIAGVKSCISNIAHQINTITANRRTNMVNLYVVRKAKDNPVSMKQAAESTAIGRLPFLNPIP